MSGPKGIITDLTSISSLLGTILDQTDQIFSKAGAAADQVGKVTSGGGTGGLGATKRGSGTQSLGLASVPTASTEMPNASGMSEAKIASGSSSAGANSMSGWMGSVFGGKAAGIVGSIATGIGTVANLAGTAMNMMPDVNTVMDRGASYYHAGLEQGNQFSSTQMQNSAKANGLYATGQSGTITDYMSRMGINFGTAAWNTTAQETANAYKYLNMDPNAAAAAYSGLNSGTTSSNLMRTMGISTSDSKGNSLSAENIFDQMDQRLMQQGVKYSVDDVNNNWQKGGLQASLQNMGLSQDQQELYRQHLLGKVTGKPTDMSKTATLDDLVNGAKKAGNENPLAPQQAINASQESLYQSYQKPYLDGIKAAVPLIQGMNKALEGVPDWAKKFKAEMDTLAGNKGTAGAAAAGGDLLGGILSIAGGVAGGKALQALISKLTGKKPPTAKGAPKSSPKGTPTEGSPAEGAPKASPVEGAPKGVPGVPKGMGLPGGFLGSLLATTGMTMADQQLNKDNAPDMFTKNGNMKFSGKTDAQSDAIAKEMKSKGQDKPVIQQWWESLFGGGTPTKTVAPGSSGSGSKSTPFAIGSSGSTVGTASAGAGGGTISFILPVNGTITDGFGPRSASSTGGVGSTFHRGIDIAAPQGTPIHAGAAGKVSAVGLDGSFGYRVMIDHAGGYQSIYAHQPSNGPAVSVGAVVTQGQLIGHVGSTGASTGPHCHFEVRLHGTAINPAPLIGKSTPIKDSPPATSAPATTQSTKPATLSLKSANNQSQSSIISSIAQPMPQFASPGSANAGFGSMGSGSSGTPTSLVASNQKSLGYGTGAGGVSGGNQSSMSVPGAKYFKQGDDYVAQDSHVNVHTGEAILNAEAADEWRRSKSGAGKSKGDVKIYLTIQDASDAEARKFAHRVKEILQEDSLDLAMGTR